MPVVTLPDGFKLNYRIDSSKHDARWLVFGNSVMTDLTIWDDQVAALAGSWNILRYDQRGHGASDAPSKPLDIETLASDLLAVIDTVGISRCIYIGLSMGVPTGIAAAAAKPQNFERLVLVDGQARSAPTGKAFWDDRIGIARDQGMNVLADQTVARWLRPSRHGSPQAERLHAMIARTSLGGFTACASALRQYDQSLALSRLEMPIHFIAGAEDGVMPSTMAALKEQVRQSSFTAIADAGHLPNFERPEQFNEILLSMLASNDNSED